MKLVKTSFAELFVVGGFPLDWCAIWFDHEYEELMWYLELMEGMCEERSFYLIFVE